MTSRGPKANLTTAAATLRSLIWATKSGDLVASEEELTNILGVSRPTLRQVARLLESEGLLQVKRGLNGGYFAARPSVFIVEASVSAYLQTVVGDDEEVTLIASALWPVVVRKVAALEPNMKRAPLEELREQVEALAHNATFSDVLEIEDRIRETIFKLVNTPYINLIFHINRLCSGQA